MRGEDEGLEGPPPSDGPKLENAKLSRPGGGESAPAWGGEVAEPPNRRLLFREVKAAGASLREIVCVAGECCWGRTRTMVSLLDELRLGFSLISA